MMLNRHKEKHLFTDAEWQSCLSAQARSLFFRVMNLGLGFGRSVSSPTKSLWNTSNVLESFDGYSRLSAYFNPSSKQHALARFPRWVRTGFPSVMIPTASGSRQTQMLILFIFMSSWTVVSAAPFELKDKLIKTKNLICWWKTNTPPLPAKCWFSQFTLTVSTN